MIEAVVFDLDDTLYLERDFVRSGFSSVAEKLEDLDIANATDAFTHLWTQFERGRRGDAFDALARRFPLRGRISVCDLVAHYRTHVPTISPLDHDTMTTVAGSGMSIGLISDGLVETQTAKVEALGLQRMFDPFILTGAWGRDFWKPHPRAFETLETELGIPGSRVAYVADNPAKDFIAPNRRDWTSIRLRVEGQLHFEAEANEPDSHPLTEIQSLAELVELLRL